MNVVDSSGWLEYFGEGANADFFAGPLADTAELLVPSISVFEVFKRVLQQRGEAAALQAVALMKQGREVPLDDTLAMQAARLSHDLKLPMADSIMLATARQFDAAFWTQDADFAAVPGVRYRAKGGTGR